MKIAILSRGPSLYSTQRLVEAGEAEGHRMVVLDTARCSIAMTRYPPALYYHRAPVEGFDAVIPRIGSRTTFYGTAIVRQFEMMGVFTLNRSLAITRARDKLRTLQLLLRKKIPIPKTCFAGSEQELQPLIELVGGPPVIMKLLEGTQGVGVMLADSKTAAESVSQAFMGLRQHVILQEYIREAGGADIRCLVVGDKVVASMRRQARGGDFRSNLHRGGIAEAVEISKAEREIAKEAVKVLGLRCAGVDLMRSDRGSLVVEVNSSPGLEGIEKATGKDIAGLIIRYLEKEARPITASSHYEG